MTTGFDVLRRSTRLAATGLVLISVLFAAAARAASPESFACYRYDRELSDMELLEKAFSYEVARYRLPPEIADGGIAGLIKSHPDCCIIERETNPFNENRNLVARLLSPPTIMVVIDWTITPTTAEDLPTRFLLTPCGEIRERWGILRK